MKKVKWELLASIALGAAGAILAGVIFPSLPDTISLGFGPGAHTGPKWLIFILPALIIAIPGLMALSNRINPNRISNRSPKARMGISVAISVILLAIECLILFLPQQQ